jgi:hypothetical protein
VKLAGAIRGKQDHQLGDPILGHLNLDHAVEHGRVAQHRRDRDERHFVPALAGGDGDRPGQRAHLNGDGNVGEGPKRTGFALLFLDVDGDRIEGRPLLHVRFEDQLQTAGLKDLARAARHQGGKDRDARESVQHADARPDDGRTDARESPDDCTQHPNHVESR